MNKAIRYIILIFSFVAICNFSGYSQQHLLKKAEHLYQLKAYSKAIDYYRDYLSSVNDYVAMSKLAECYLKIGDTQSAERFYSIVANSNNSIPEEYFNYGKVLMANKKYTEAADWFKKYSSIYPNNKLAKTYIKSCLTIDELMIGDSLSYKVYNLSINTPHSDFGAMFYKNGIVFLSAKKTKGQRTFEWTGESYLDMYYSMNGVEENWREAIPFSKEINSKYHEGPCSFNTAQDLIYFTRNNLLNGKEIPSASGVTKLNIYKATKQGEDWADVELFEINNTEYSMGHPALSPDGKLLYFISDMPGGYGGTDLYVSKRMGYKWSKPVNLGSRINTPGDEMFPFVDNEGRLFFSSDGLPGLGGLDIYVSSFNGYNWEYPKNMRPPFNTSKDDFAYIYDKQSERGFFSSNREGGKGGDDIYMFERNYENLRPLNGKILIANSRLPISDVEVVLQDYNNYEIIRKTDKSGLFNFMIEPGKNYNIVVSKNGFHTKTILFFSDDYNPDDNINLEILLEESAWFRLEGQIGDAEQESPLQDVLVTLYNKTYDISSSVLSDQSGAFVFDLDPESDYIVDFKKDGYFTERIDDLSTFGKEESEIIHYDVGLGLQKLDVNQSVELKNIYYALNDWQLNADAKKECDKLANLLKNNPHITIELSSHTDSRASDEYNLELSQKRAEAVVEYLVQRGIEKSRMIPKGYGETRLKNRCSNGVPCPESLHQQNRRTEFKVLVD